MGIGPTEIYRPRQVTDLGIATVGPLRLKVYGLAVAGREASDDLLATARRFIEDEVLTRVTAMGESNDLGFVILHPGDLGITISAHWWAQGSVLCQQNYRRPYDAEAPLDNSRPVVACVWELALINAEQEAWRATMMTAKPDPTAYLSRRASFELA